MTDIARTSNLVSRLRHWANLMAEPSDPFDNNHAAADVLSAADEIERLRAALTDCVDYIELDGERPHFLFAVKSLLATAPEMKP